MRGIVTDLTLRLGTAYDFGKYQWAAGLEGNVYKQTNDVDFYRELGVIPEFQMTGLGTEYSRSPEINAPYIIKVEDME